MAHTSVPIDTDRAVFRRQVDRWREMSVSERAVLADRLSIDVATLAVAGISLKGPVASTEGLKRELARRRYGIDIAETAFRAAHDT